jgi:hypothetical protein
MLTTTLPAEVIGTLHEGREAYVALATAGGPHLTPELYAWSSDRLWFAAATGTLKTRVLGTTSQAAALVAAGGRTVLLRGTVESFDLRHPLDLALRVARLPLAGWAGTTYVVRNAVDLAAFAADLALGRLGSRIPEVRVLHALTPTDVAVVEAGAVTGTWGDWPLPRPPVPNRTEEPGGAPAVAALPGPLAIPGTWHARTSRFETSPAVLDLAGVGARFPMGLVLDEYVAPGPAAKVGTLLRGEGRRVRGRDDAVTLEVERRVEWSGTTLTARRPRGRRAAVAQAS